MLPLNRLLRSTRYVGFAAALAASLATTSRASFVHTELPIVLATPAPGEIQIRRFELEIRGHPAFVDDAGYTIELYFHPAPTSSFDATIALVGPDERRDCEPVVDDAGTPTGMRCLAVREWSGVLDAICSDGTPCVAPFRLESFDATTGGVFAEARLRVTARFGRDDPPPGEFVLREVTP